MLNFFLAAYCLLRNDEISVKVHSTGVIWISIRSSDPRSGGSFRYLKGPLIKMFWIHTPYGCISFNYYFLSTTRKMTARLPFSVIFTFSAKMVRKGNGLDLRAHQRNCWIHYPSGITGFFDAPWSEWSWINVPILITPKERILNYIF